jgi:hypothetical protein
LADIPSPLTYATLTADYFSVRADSADLGSPPDIALPTGSVVIVPNARLFKTTTGTISEFYLETVTARIVAGQLYGPDGATTLRILATDSTGITPSGFQWTATFKFEGWDTQPGPVIFAAPGGTTINLAALDSVPAAPAPGVTYVTTTSLASTLTSYATTAALATANAAITALTTRVAALEAALADIAIEAKYIVATGWRTESGGAIPTSGARPLVFNGQEYTPSDGIPDPVGHSLRDIYRRPRVPS